MANQFKPILVVGLGGLTKEGNTMSKSYTPIPFFVDEIEIDAHTASYREHLGHISLRDFADGQPVSLYQCDETGDFMARKGKYPNIVFIEGQEI